MLIQPFFLVKKYMVVNAETMNDSNFFSAQ